MKHRMKVLMTADAVGGVWTYAMELCAALAEHEVEIVLATLGPRPKPAQCEQAAGLRNVRLVSGDFRLEWMSDSREDVMRSGGWLRRVAAQESVDLVHLNGYAHAALPWSQPTVVVGHSCVWSWWQAVHGEPPPWKEWGLYRQRVIAGWASADCVVAPTQAFLRTLCELYGGRQNMRVIHNARSVHHFTADHEHERLPIVLACGRLWDEAKRLRTLDAIAAELPWRVFIAGEPTSPDGCTAAASAATGLGELSADAIATWMQRASIFVHPASYEPFGLAVLEAALAGCALVLADLPGLRELWGEAAVFVDAGDERELHAALMDLIEHPWRRIRLARAARARATRFSPALMGATYAGLYRELLPQRMPEKFSTPHATPETAHA